MDFLDEIIEEAIENGMDPRHAKRTLILMRKYINSGKFPFLTYNDWQNILYYIIDVNYQTSGQAAKFDEIVRNYVEDKNIEIKKMR